MSLDARLDSVLARLGPADRDWLIRQLEPAWKRRARRLEERDGLIRAMAMDFGTLASGRAVAAAIRAALLRPNQAQLARVKRIRRLSGGRHLSLSALRRILAGLDGSNSPQAMSHATCDNDEQETGGPDGSGAAVEEDQRQQSSR